MVGALARTAFSFLAESTSLKRAASRYGMRSPNSFARRFIAGETVEEAVAAARALEAQRLLVTLDLLGESVASREAATTATREYVAAMETIAAAGIGRNISLKLTQIGLTIDRATTVDNLRRVLDAAQQHGFFVRIDMENSPYTEATLDTFETVWNIGCRNVGVVIQSSLRRSVEDVRRVNRLGAHVRLVKGAYREPREVAFARKADVDAAYVELMTILFKDGVYPAIATHDPAMIDAARRLAAQAGVAADQFEFQMLYGVRRDLQASLVGEGYRCRVYVPFGAEWFPYFMRRLGERPANVGFVMRSVLREKR
jgi:proline dehydrogenase